jgi:hypothetical protein
MEGNDWAGVWSVSIRDKILCDQTFEPTALYNGPLLPHPVRRYGTL